MAVLAPLVTSGGFQLAMAGVSAAGSIAAGNAQRRQYEEQARQAELRGRSEVLAYKQKGVDALRNLN